MSVRIIILVIFILEFYGQGTNGEVNDNMHKWRGLSQSRFKNMKKCVKALKATILKDLGKNYTSDDIHDTMFGDIAIDDVDCIKLRNSYQKRHSNTRSKRKAVNFNLEPDKQWPLPIRYLIDEPTFTTAEVGTITEALANIEENTCIRFNQVPFSDPNRRLVIIGDDSGCWSYVGLQTNTQRQIISLKTNFCLVWVGIAVHEIFHALGIHHEQVRFDRDQHVHINYTNIFDNAIPNYYIEEQSISYGVPYDFGSVLHYGRLSASKNGLETVSSFDPLFSYTYGTPIKASFMDFTCLNRMYGCLNTSNAPDNCRTGHLPTCTNGGYPNPGINTLCDSCLCPDGLTGDCSEPESGSSGCSPLSGTISVTSSEEQCLISPNYGGFYSRSDKCSWIIQGPVGSTIRLYFDLTGFFGLEHDAAMSQCYHYVEIRYNNNFTETGPRFCGSDNSLLNQDTELVSTSNRVLVIFRSDFLVFEPNNLRGFKLCYHLEIESPSTTMQETVAPPVTTPQNGGLISCYSCRNSDINNCIPPVSNRVCMGKACGVKANSNNVKLGCMNSCPANYNRKRKHSSRYCCTTDLCNDEIYKAP